MSGAGDFLVLEGSKLFPGISGSMLSLLGALADHARDRGHQELTGIARTTASIPAYLWDQLAALAANGLLEACIVEDGGAGASGYAFTVFGAETVAALDAIMETRRG